MLAPLPGLLLGRGRGEGGGRLGGQGLDQLMETHHVQHFPNLRGLIADVQLAAQPLQLLRQQHENANAGGTQIMDLAQVEDDAMAADQQGILQGLADRAAPGRVHPALQFHIHDLLLQAGADFHGSASSPQGVASSR